MNLFRLLRCLHLTATCIILMSALTLTSCGTTVVTDEVLTPLETNKLYMPHLYPIMQERHDYSEDFCPTKYATTNNEMVNVYYSDYKKLLHRNADLNFTPSEGEAYGYIKCDDIDLKLKHKSWYFIPAILTGTLCWLLGCPVLDAVATERASFSILDYQGRVIKEIQVEGKGRTSGTFYVLGKDINRHATIKAHKEVLKALNEQIYSQRSYISTALKQAITDDAPRRDRARAAVTANAITFNLGLQALSIHEDEKAIDLFSQTIHEHPDHYLAYFGRGMAYTNTSKYTKALSDFKKTTMLAPDYADAYYYQSFLLQQLRRNEESFVPMMKAVEAAPENDNYRMAYAALLENDEQWEAAQRQYEKVLEHNPDRVEAIDRIADIKQKKNASQIAEFNKTQELLDRQLQIMQRYNQTMQQNLSTLPANNYQSISTSSTATSSTRSRISIQNDLEKANQLLLDMMKNQDNDSSMVNQTLYDGMIQRQRQKIKELEAELRNAKE